jgi:hypothetical protein
MDTIPDKTILSFISIYPTHYLFDPFGVLTFTQGVWKREQEENKFSYCFSAF